jgi:hypothetical protein
MFDAVLEIHPVSQNWDRAEISMISPLDCDRSRIFAELFQLAALTAGARGCTQFISYLHHECEEAVEIMSGLGRCCRDGETVSIDITDYASSSWRRSC